MSDELRDAIVYHTSFLNYDASVLTRVTYVFADMHEQITCAQCDRLIQTKGSVQKQSPYCSHKCSSASDTTKEKRKKTNIERYGVENLFSDPDYLSDIMMRKYGVKNAVELPEVKEKLRVVNTANSAERMNSYRKTVNERYGVEHTSKLQHVKDKMKQTNMERYGTECTLSSPDIKEKSRISSIERYGVDNPAKSSDVIKKIQETKLQRYGDPFYNNREKAEQTMIELYGIHHSKLNWSDDVRELMSEPEMLKIFVHDKTVEQAATELGIAPTTMRNMLYKHDIMDFKSRKNQYETMVDNLLMQHEVNFIKNDRSILDGMELDFYIPSLRVAIECNGIFWHSELMGKTRTYHLEKTNRCAAAGIRLVHLWDYQFDANWPIIKSMLTHLINKTESSVNARSLVVRNVSPRDADAFFTDNHLYGNAPSSMRLGLYSDSELLACMTFGKSRFKDSEYELIRYAAKLNTNVRGGAGKLLSAFLKISDVERIVTYANRDHSAGNIYDTLGFTLIGTTPPSYHYFKNRNVFNRLQFQKHKLCDILTEYDPSLSEWENMKNNGYNRFWTVGNFKYEFINK